MVKRMTFKQFIFIIPLLCFIGVFSIYPIITSCMYTLFDYRTNDQEYNSFYMNEKLNTSLLVEDCQYVNYFISADITMVSEEDQAAFTEIMDSVTEVMNQYDGETTTRNMSAEETETIKGFIEKTTVDVKAIYDKYPDVEFYNRENIDTILQNLSTCIVESNFTGVANFAKLFQDSRFWAALAHTLIFMALSVSIEFVLGMCLALIMNKAMKGIGIIRTIALIPWAIPTAVSALIWSYLYDGSYGIISKAFESIGLISSQASMLLTVNGAMASAVLSDVWKTTPYMALLLLAGLQVIDRGLYESASIDGASPVKTFFSITLPLMKPSILVALLFRTLDAFRVYDLIAILTNGGPGNGTETLSVYAYKLMFNQSNYGYGSTIVIGMFVCVAAIAILYVKVLGADVLKND
ncbi:MAG: sugar ABC transporter permease [Lachnospiraceae bacterium]|nr:sugar ABC transporter permease [Lachnospiraceae bacterium]MDD3615616.1 sugar ABC transporter permease [Lachnospiraceae bacterium]